MKAKGTDINAEPKLGPGNSVIPAKEFPALRFFPVTHSTSFIVKTGDLH
jgi:hypothetical protein